MEELRNVIKTKTTLTIIYDSSVLGDHSWKRKVLENIKDLRNVDTVIFYLLESGHSFEEFSYKVLRSLESNQGMKEAFFYYRNERIPKHVDFLRDQFPKLRLESRRIK